MDPKTQKIIESISKKDLKKVISLSLKEKDPQELLKQAHLAGVDLTQEQLEAVLQTEKQNCELTDEQLDAVNGGFFMSSDMSVLYLERGDDLQEAVDSLHPNDRRIWEENGSQVVYTW